jgi:hypothetical protein
MCKMTHSSLEQSDFTIPHVTSASTRSKPDSVIKNGRSKIQSGHTLLPRSTDLRKRQKTTLSSPDLWTQATSSPSSMRSTGTTPPSSQLNFMVLPCSPPSAKLVRIVICASVRVSCLYTKAKYLSKFSRANNTLSKFWKACKLLGFVNL